MRAVLLEQRFEVADDVLGQVLQVLARLGEVGLHLLHLLAVLVDVEQRNAADAHLQQPLDVRVGQLANELFPERLEALVHRGEHGLVGLALARSSCRCAPR